VAVCIRLKRLGRTNRPHWRICATEKRSARDGRVVEELGVYDAHLGNEDKVKIHRDRVVYWLKIGAKPSETVGQLLRHLGLDAKGNEIAPKPWSRKTKGPPAAAAARVAAEKAKEAAAAAPPEAKGGEASE